MRYVLALILIAGLLVGCDDSTTTQAQAPTPIPTSEPAPTPDPTPDPTATPRSEPTATPTTDPTSKPTLSPTATPTSDPTATATPDPTATPTPNPATPTPILHGTVNAPNGLNVRSEPVETESLTSVRTHVLRTLQFKDKVKLTGRSRQSAGLNWVELDPDGWVLERYLCSRRQTGCMEAAEATVSAMTRVGAGDYASAIIELTRAIDLNPQYPPAYVIRGLAYANLGEYERAIQDYDEALLLDPLNTEASNNRWDRSLLPPLPWACQGPTPTPTMPPTHSQIAFISGGPRFNYMFSYSRDTEGRVREGGFIYVMDADGGNVRRLTENKTRFHLSRGNPQATPGSPTWSPDGSQIAFVERGLGTHNGINVIDVDDCNLRIRVVGGLMLQHPAWSPDGTRIAFSTIGRRDEEEAFDVCGGWYDGRNVGCLRDHTDIHVMDADGKNRQQLTDTPGGNEFPQWSPDGTRIAFTSGRDGDSTFNIHVMDADGRNVRQLTETPGWKGDLAWSPDGTRIAFMSNRDGYQNIYVMDADGRNVQQLTDDPGRDLHPTWSPDGTLIAFTSNRDGDGNNIYVMDADGRNIRQLTDTPGWNSHPAWSPVR